MTNRFPEWIRRSWGSGEDFRYTKDLLKDLGLHTVCQSARCPNLGECWGRRTATMMLLGNVCTRSCRYCSVKTGRPESVAHDEPGRVAEAIRRLGVKHIVLTSVTRDDLPDGGADHFAKTVEAVHAVNPHTTVEVLVPDFQGNRAAIGRVLDAEPEVFSHNIETVERLYTTLRGKRCDYRLALRVLGTARELVPNAILKSALMVGHGETAGEVKQTLRDLLDVGCAAVSIGQYLRPTKKQCEVVEFAHPGRFLAYENMAYEMGFEFAVAGPFVRSSYRSEELMQKPFAQHALRSKRRMCG